MIHPKQEMLDDGAYRQETMKIEIERKFLLANEDWTPFAVAKRFLRDGLVVSGSGKVRVRVEHPKAWLTVKGKRCGLGRAEFEYEIPLVEAELMLSDLCNGEVLEKTRHLVPFGGMMWEIDQYHGILEGLCYAEVELTFEEQEITLPAWAGVEVTGDPSHSTSGLLRQRINAARKASCTSKS